MRSGLVTFVIVLFVQISFGQKKGLPLKVIEATEQHWVSGAPGGRTGTKYAIKVYINTQQKVDFQNIWLGKENVPFNVEFFSLDIPKKIQYGDSLLLTYNKVNNEVKEPNARKRLPIQYKGVALIESVIDGKARYFIVKNIQTLPDSRGR
jgi:hypothetical protein